MNARGVEGGCQGRAGVREVRVGCLVVIVAGQDEHQDDDAGDENDPCRERPTMRPVLFCLPGGRGSFPMGCMP